MNLTRAVSGGLGLGLWLAACGGNPTPIGLESGPAPSGPPPTGPVAVRMAPARDVPPVEVGGIAPNDTVVTIHRGIGRVVILRHGPPDRTEFVELTLPPSVFEKAPHDTIRVTVRTRPGVYGVELSADADWGPGAELAFKYAVHFEPPTDALRRYGTFTEVERRLVVGRRERSGDVTIYLSSHPAPDVLRAKIPGDGTYLMVVGK